MKGSCYSPVGRSFSGKRLVNSWMNLERFILYMCWFSLGSGWSWFKNSGKRDLCNSGVVYCCPLGFQIYVYLRNYVLVSEGTSAWKKHKVPKFLVEVSVSALKCGAKFFYCSRSFSWFSSSSLLNLSSNSRWVACWDLPCQRSVAVFRLNVFQFVKFFKCLLLFRWSLCDTDKIVSSNTIYNCA